MTKKLLTLAALLAFASVSVHAEDVVPLPRAKPMQVIPEGAKLERVILQGEHTRGSVPISGIRLSDWLHREAHGATVRGARSRRSTPRSP
jgi:hypothetical protein